MNLKWIGKTVFVPLVLSLLAFSICGGTLQASDSAETNTPGKTAIQSGELYLPSDSAMADVTSAMESARDHHKLLLVVMGANWCHDSRALAARLYEKPLSDVIEANYETVFVDVGFLENGRDVITSLGSPVYYATPTVLIVDADSGQVTNAENRHQWADAASISMQASLDYFAAMADKSSSLQASEPAIPASLQELFNEIDVFEQVQADRLYQAYAVLGPMLRAYKNGDKDAFSEPSWNAVRDFRYRVPEDLETLRSEALERTSAGETGIQLNYPQYPAFPWEQ